MKITAWKALPKWFSHSEHWFECADTHRCIDPFRELLAAAPEGARIIHLGDLADRGRYLRQTGMNACCPALLIKGGTEVGQKNKNAHSYLL